MGIDAFWKDFLARHQYLNLHFHSAYAIDLDVPATLLVPLLVALLVSVGFYLYQISFVAVISKFGESHFDWRQLLLACS